MKNYYVILFVLLIYSCSVKNKKEKFLNSANGTWLLYEMKDVSTTEIENYTKKPFITINKTKINGNNGCNNFFSSIDSISKNKIYFSKFGETKKMCRDMKIPNAFSNLITKVDSYYTKESKLVFLSKQEKVLTFTKQ